MIRIAFRRALLAASAALAVAAGPADAAPADAPEPKVLNIYNWSAC